MGLVVGLIAFDLVLEHLAPERYHPYYSRYRQEMETAQWRIGHYYPGVVAVLLIAPCLLQIIRVEVT